VALGHELALILVIDDEAAVRQMIRRILEHAGYAVIEAPGGRAGIKLLRNQPVDLVMTDIIMPDMEGIETILQIRRDFPAIRILAMSGGGAAKGSSMYLYAASKLGADAILAKPFRARELCEVVKNLLAPEL
jgi:DNA-binding response OmpR family regulator